MITVPSITTHLGSTAPAPRPRVSIRDDLSWRPGASTTDTRGLVETVGPDLGWATFGTFSRALRTAGVLDNEGVALPGVFVLLPLGVRLVEALARTVRTAFEARGLSEHDYPFLAPAETLIALERVMPVRQRVLYAVRSPQVGREPADTILCPTGEPVVYEHWRARVRSTRDLPIRIYRRARYFRPVARGKGRAQGVFRSAEAGDVFEFHSCYESLAQQQEELRGFAAMLEEVTAAWHVPVLWGIRPPWTNESAVSRWTLGGDVPLPVGATVQVGCLYDQGQILSRAFGITCCDEGGARTYPYQAAGAITRRLVLAHLFLGMHAGGELLVHPDVAPDQIVVVLQPGVAGTDPALGEILATVGSTGFRVSGITVDRRERNRPEILRLRRAGTPLLLLVQGRRSSDDRLKIVLTRADTHQEAVIFADSVADIAPVLSVVLREIGEAFDQRTRSFVERQQVWALTRPEVREIVASHRIAGCPLVRDAQVVREVESESIGEVLSFSVGQQQQPCVVTGQPTDSVAWISHRV